MFDWLRRRLRSQDIFRYYDGVSWCYADPIVLDRAMSEQLPQWWDVAVKLDIPDDAPGGLPSKMRMICEQNREESRSKLVAMVRAVFTLRSVDRSGNGVSDIACLKLLDDFCWFQARLVKTAGPLLLSPGRLGVVLPSPAATTEPSAASTSEGNESPMPNPKLSPTE